MSSSSRGLGKLFLDSAAHPGGPAAGQPTRISPKAHSAIAEARASGAGLGVSEIDLLELATLARRNKLRVHTGVQMFLDEIESRFFGHGRGGNSPIACGAHDLVGAGF
jgi:PIN domain nuclease of toxin-antitoxin system